MSKPEATAKSPECTVGQLRQQCALTPAGERVVLVMRDPKTGKMEAAPYRVVRCYPDTTDEHDKFDGATFKLEIEAKYRLEDAFRAYEEA